MWREMFGSCSAFQKRTRNECFEYDKIIVNKWTTTFQQYCHHKEIKSIIIWEQLHRIYDLIKK